MLTKIFFERNPELVAKDLLGKLLVRKNGDRYQISKVVETEAYLGSSDKASHSYNGITKRNTPMFGPAGYSYVYFTYGIHWLLNIVTEKERKPSAVLIRAVEPLVDSQINISSFNFSEKRKIGSGPARLTRWMNINGDMNNIDISKRQDFWFTNEIEFAGEKIIAQQMNFENIISASRVGVESAKEDKDLLLRFYIKDSRYISKI